MKFKNLFYICLLFVFNLTIAQEQFKTFSNPKYGFTVDYPSNWVLLDLEGYDFFVSEPLEDSLQVLTNVEIKVREGLEIPLKTRFDLDKLKLKENDEFKNFQICSLKEIKFKKQIAYSYVGSAEVGQIKIKWEKLLFNHNKYYIEITTTSSDEKFISNKKITDRIVNSFNWKKEP